MVIHHWKLGLQKTLTVHFWLECSFSRIMQLLCKVCSIKKSTVQENRCLPCSPRALGFHPKFLEEPSKSFCYLESLFSFKQWSQSWKCWGVSNGFILTRPWEFTSSVTAALFRKRCIFSSPHSLACLKIRSLFKKIKFLNTNTPKVSGQALPSFFSSTFSL